VTLGRSLAEATDISEELLRNFGLYGQERDA
jgi:hypothetical protein